MCKLAIPITEYMEIIISNNLCSSPPLPPFSIEDNEFISIMSSKIVESFSNERPFYRIKNFLKIKKQK